MEILVAKTAGFCFGVNKAVSAVYKLLNEGRTVCTLGPIIHNPQLVADLEKRGVRIVGSPDDVPPGAMLVIRSHGVPASVYDRLREREVDYLDATCPFVAKIHRIVERHSSEGYAVLIAGDPEHPEVMGIRGHCRGPSFVFTSLDDLERLSRNEAILKENPVVLVSQTTFQMEIWEKCSQFAKKHYTNPLVFDTICNATAERQHEAVALSQKSDVMVIVGGRQSSNTAKLRDVCQQGCRTILIETADELSSGPFAGAKVVGLTAGASTPADIIKEVLSTMSEIVNNEVQENETLPTAEEAAAPASESPAAEQAAETAPEAPAEAVPEAPAKSFEEMSFEEALEASLQSLSTDERVRGVVVGIAPNEVQVEVVGRKQAGYIPADELSATGANPADLVKIGDELDLLIMRTNDQEGTIMLSKRRVDALKGWDTVVAAEASGDILDGVVTDVIKGGLLAVTHGVRVFIPASQASAVRMEDLSPLLKQEVRFKIIEVNQSRRRAVGSIRAVAREERKEKEAAFWAQAEVGQRYTGVVKSLTSYGAFVDLGGVDGMVHISELSWGHIRTPGEVVKPGDQIEVFVLKFDPEKKKISLGYKTPEMNPWNQFLAKYSVGDVVTVKIVKLVDFGAFAEIMPGVDGLIHISQISDHRVEKASDALQEGQEVEAKIIDVDTDRKRISLSIRTLLVPQNDED